MCFFARITYLLSSNRSNKAKMLSNIEGYQKEMSDFYEKINDYNGYRRYDFHIGENAVIIVAPENPVPGRRWIWRAEFFDAFPQFDLAMLERGWWLAFINVGNTFGCPAAMKRFDAFYREMTEKYGFNHLPVLEGLSRGGLYVYNWAADNTDKVGAIYADNPVCDFKSWPGGKGTGPGSHDNWVNLIKCYGFASEKEAMIWNKNPVDNMKSIVSAGIPLIHIYGDADEIVPWEENTKIMAERVNALGGKIKIICKSGCKHHPHGPVNPADLAEWIMKNALTERR